MKNIMAGVSLLIATGASAQSADDMVAALFSSAPPPFCEYGKVRQPIMIGGSCSEAGGCSFDWGGFFDSFSYLQADAGTYHLAGSAVRLKGDGEYGVDKGERVHFFDQQDGYLGFSKANSEGNAYLTYNPDKRGSRDFWVMRWDIHTTPVNQPDPADQYFAQQNYMDYGHDYEIEYFFNNGHYPSSESMDVFGTFSGPYSCSKKEVVIQDPPSISVTLNAEKTIATVHYSVDPEHSKVARERTRLHIEQYQSESMVEKHAKSAIKYFYVPTSGRGSYQIVVDDNLHAYFRAGVYQTLTISDGTFTASTGFTFRDPTNLGGLREGTREACGRAGKSYPCYL